MDSNKIDYRSHTTVLLEETIKFLVLDTEVGHFADLTFGGGGHSLALLRSNPNLNLLAFDQDIEAVNRGRKLLVDSGFGERSELFHTNFEKFSDFIPEEVRLTGVIADLGVSSHHFDDPLRGFSYRSDGPLDMRMNSDDDDQLTASDIVNEEREEVLADIFFRFGEERFSRRIAAEIVKQRAEKRFETTKELENTIFHCYPKRFRFGKTNPSTRVFQALRIYVNRENRSFRKYYSFNCTATKKRWASSYD